MEEAAARAGWIAEDWQPEDWDIGRAGGRGAAEAELLGIPPKLPVPKQPVLGSVRSDLQ